MIFRIFIAIVLMASVYLGFETVRLTFTQNALLSAANEHSLTPVNSDITFVSFLDYNCPHCKDAHPVIMNAIQSDGRVQYIPRPVDFIETEGLLLSRLPYAAAKQGMFWEMHEALIENYRVVDEQVLQDITLELGIDQDKLMQDYESEEVIKLSKKNHDVHGRLGLDGTPAYAIDKTILFQPFTKTPTALDFQTIFDEARGLR